MDDSTSLISGVLFTLIIVFILKAVIRQSRPSGGSTFGMPSTRGATVGFLVTWAFLHAEKCKVLLGVLCVVLVTFSYWHKIAFEAHTWSQMIVGTLLGACIALVGDRIPVCRNRVDDEKQ